MPYANLRRHPVEHNRSASHGRWAEHPHCETSPSVRRSWDVYQLLDRAGHNLARGLGSVPAMRRHYSSSAGDLSGILYIATLYECAECSIESKPLSAVVAERNHSLTICSRTPIYCVMEKHYEAESTEGTRRQTQRSFLEHDRRDSPTCTTAHGKRLCY